MWEEETTDNKFIGCFLNTDLNLYWGVRRWFLNTDYTDYTDKPLMIGELWYL